MPRQITPGMQDVDDDDLLRPVEEHQEMLPCPREPEIVGVIDQNGATSAARLTTLDRRTTLENRMLVEDTRREALALRAVVAQRVIPPPGPTSSTPRDAIAAA